MKGEDLLKSLFVWFFLEIYGDIGMYLSVFKEDKKFWIDYNPDGSESSYLSSYDTRNAASQLIHFALGILVIPPFGIA